MKKTYFLILIIVLILVFSSCNKGENISQETVSTFENTTKGVTPESENPDIHLGFELNISEIELPADGETVEYSPAFLLFSGDDGYQIKANSAERQGKKITFYTDETEYYFDPLGMTLLTSDGEVFISLNGVKTENNTYAYEIYQYTVISPADPVQNTQAEIKDCLGDSYDAKKNYYYVTYCNVFSTSIE